MSWELGELASGPLQVTIANLQGLLPIAPAEVKQLVERTLSWLGVEQAEISIVVVDDAAIRVINARHLAHDWATDVVSFPFGPAGSPEFGGEVVISAETALREATARAVAPHDEFALYLVHGLLHCYGFDDRSDADSATMRQREGLLLEALGIKNPFPQAEAR